MAISPHQPKSLSDRISELKEDLASKKALRAQMEAIGQTFAGGGMSTTYPSYGYVCAEIAQLEAVIESLTARLNGEDAPLPGVVLHQVRSEYV
jgi:hypothetical protein